MNCKAILTDIEGTTSSLSFVKDVLFPYARARIAQFVQEQQNDEAVHALLQEVQAISGQGWDVAALGATLEKWIDEDQKITPLKTLQGLIWQQGYQLGDFHGHIYADAVEALKQWHEAGLSLNVYSSGSVQAQKLLFAYTEYGDLTDLFSNYFDTHVGGKREVGSYRSIAHELNLDAADILFLSDIPEELAAAQKAGMQVLMLTRHGEAEPHADFPHVSSFAEIEKGA